MCPEGGSSRWNKQAGTQPRRQDGWPAAGDWINKWINEQTAEKKSKSCRSARASIASDVASDDLDDMFIIERSSFSLRRRRRLYPHQERTHTHSHTYIHTHSLQFERSKSTIEALVYFLLFIAYIRNIGSINPSPRLAVKQRVSLWNGQNENMGESETLENKYSRGLKVDKLRATPGDSFPDCVQQPAIQQHNAW